MVKRMQRVFGDIDALMFVDNKLDEERRAAFQAYLAATPGEAERVETWSRQNDHLKASFANLANEAVPVWLRLGNVSLERGVTPGVDDLPAPATRANPGVVMRLAPRKTRGGRDKLLSAVALTLGITALAGFAVSRDLLPFPHFGFTAPVSATADPYRALVGRAVDAYRTFAQDPVHPVEIASTQQSQLEHWLQRRMSIPVRAPDLRAEGWSLLGGRLVPGDLGPAAFFVYENSAAERMGLYMARTTVAPRHDLSFDVMAGGGAMSWVSGPLGIVLTVGKDPDWLSRNADDLKRRIEAVQAE